MPSVGEHSGRFNWKRYSRYKGNLKDYWTDNRRAGQHRMTHYKLTIEAQSNLEPDDLLDLIEYLVGGGLTMNRIDLEVVGSDS